MTIPQYGDEAAIKAAIEEAENKIGEARAQVMHALVEKRAAQMMCRHDYDHNFDPAKCRICGNWKGSNGLRIEIKI